jgi:hypothetical protein
LLADPIIIDRELWIGYKIYVWFIVLTFAWAGQRIFRVWLRVPPFSSKLKQPPDPGYLKSWQVLARSVVRLGGLVLIGWGLLASAAVFRIASESPQFVNTTPMMLSVVGDLTVPLLMTVIVLLVLYLIWWHLRVRTEHYDS